MLKVKPEHHPLLIPLLSGLLLALVICILVLAAFTKSTLFWIAAALFDLGISYVGVRKIIDMQKPEPNSPSDSGFYFMLYLRILPECYTS